MARSLRGAQGAGRAPLAEGLDGATHRRSLRLHALAEQVLRYMADFEKVMAEGTVDEKRTFIRAFARRIALDPEAGTGRAELYALPRFTALPAGAGNAANSSLIMVAGAGFEPATFRL